MNKEHGLKIKQQLKSKRLSFTSVAKSMPDPKPSPQAVRQVAFLIRKSARIVAVLASVLDAPISDIWPENKTPLALPSE